MKERDKFEKNWGILVKAYLNGTLEWGNDCACAVGNLIAGNLGYTFTMGTRQGELLREVLSWREENPHWYGIACWDGTKRQEQLESTGYPPELVFKIERGFEYATQQAFRSAQYDDPEFEGLSAVLDILLEIHETPMEEAEEARAQFFALKK